MLKVRPSHDACLCTPMCSELVGLHWTLKFTLIFSTLNINLGWMLEGISQNGWISQSLWPLVRIRRFGLNVVNTCFGFLNFVIGSRTPMYSVWISTFVSSVCLFVAVLQAVDKTFNRNLRLAVCWRQVDGIARIRTGHCSGVHRFASRAFGILNYVIRKSPWPRRVLKRVSCATSVSIKLQGSLL